MNYFITSDVPTKQESDCLIVPVLANKSLSSTGKLLDETTQGQLSRVIRDDLNTELGKLVVLHDPVGLNAKRVLAVSCGDKPMLSGLQFQSLIEAMAAEIKSRDINSICCYLDDFPSLHDNLSWKISCAVRQLESSLYAFQRFKTERKAASSLQKVFFHLSDIADKEAVDYAIRKGMATAAGIMITKDLANTPANHATPSDLAEYARQMVQAEPALEVEVYDTTQAVIKEMGAFKAVSQGSDEPAKFVVVQYQPPQPTEEAPILLVGKGITFDSGGISIKPSKDMGDMKFDMTGAASVLGTIKALAQLEVPIRIVGLLPLTENLPNGSALKPGDVIKTLSGKTVEVLDTDAEGRLILADALTYSRRFNPAVVIDIATLTGAVVVALGEITTGLMTSDESLRVTLEKAGESSLDRVWPLPLFEEYQALISSNVADMSNLGFKGAGSITAACFLARFTEGLRWAHLDIAGTAYVPGRSKRATGRPVPLLVQYVLDYCEQLKVHDK